MRRRSRSAKVKAIQIHQDENVIAEVVNEESNICHPFANQSDIEMSECHLSSSSRSGSQVISSSPINTPPVVNKIHHLISSFRERAMTIKAKITKPIATPFSETPSEDRMQAESPQEVSPSASSISVGPDWLEKYGDEDFINQEPCWRQFKGCLTSGQIGVFDPQSYFYISWLMLVTIAFLYNCWIIFLRASFPYQTESNLTTFFAFDYASDLIYILDILIFKCRVTFVEKGQVIRDAKRCQQHYHDSSMYKFDCLSLLPLDIAYLLVGPKPMLRISRLFKVQTFWQFFDRIDAIAKWPYFFRILRTLTYMMFLIHLNACAYYMISFLEGFDANDWVYNGAGNAYIRCFYFAIRTATSISGKMPKPTNVYEYLFMTVSWLFGIFVFAFLIGQIRDIVATATQNKAHYRQILDSIIRHMDNLNLDNDLQSRVRQWIAHTWDQQKVFNESKILYLLPMKIRTDLAMNIHYDMLNRVDLFKECDKNAIRDMVVKLKPVMFLPNDYICRRGEVGYEMYIVSEGFVNILRDESGGKESVICTLGPGGVFGEISVLGIPGLSRRTATVKSVGYSNLFMLNKTDLWETLRNYPETQNILRNKAKQVMRERAVRDRLISPESSIDVECIIKETRSETPKFLKTVMQVLPPDSSCRKMIERSCSLNTTHPPSPSSSGIQKHKNLLQYLPSLSIKLPTDESDNSENGGLSEKEVSEDEENGSHEYNTAL